MAIELLVVSGPRVLEVDIPSPQEALEDNIPFKLTRGRDGNFKGWSSEMTAIEFFKAIEYVSQIEYFPWTEQNERSGDMRIYLDPNHLKTQSLGFDWFDAEIKGSSLEMRHFRQKEGHRINGTFNGDVYDLLASERRVLLNAGVHGENTLIDPQNPLRGRINDIPVTLKEFRADLERQLDKISLKEKLKLVREGLVRLYEERWLVEEMGEVA